MSDTATVLIAAFGGGLAGAVLQPLTAYALRRAGVRDDNRKKIEQTMRRMLSEWLGFGLKVVLTAMEIQVRRRQRQPELSRQELGGRLRVGPQPNWEPERITDEELGQMAEEVYKLLNSFWLTLFDPLVEDASIDNFVKAFSPLRKRIILRMDELDWPEIEDVLRA